MKRILSALLVICMLVALCACMEAKPKEFSSDGLTVTLTDEFKKNTVGGYTVCYATSDVAVFALKEPFSLLEGLDELSLDDYAQLVLNANASKGATEISKKDGLTSMEYDFLNEAEDQLYSYYCAMFKSGDAFWLVQFACKAEDYDEHRATFVNWAKTVSFDS